MREGQESTLHPGMGVFALCMGPDSPMPGERLQIVIYNHADEIVRRFEQIRGTCVQEGYATFFEGDPRARQAIFLWPLVDIDAAGVVTILHPDYGKTQGPEPYRTILAAWVARWGIPDAPPNAD
jgi:hypothetical protein